MQGIAHTGPGGVAVSAFGYGYDAGGSITRWTQSQPFHKMEPMSAWTIEQDAADQLTAVSVEGRAAGRQVFSYDLAGNRLTAQSGNATSGMNRGDRLLSDRGHGLHIDWGVCPGKMSYQWNRNNDLFKGVGH